MIIMVIIGITGIVTKGSKKNLEAIPGKGTWWRSWLRHCSMSRKVMGSIPNYVIGIFH
jgi:hypothetical protein